MFGITLQQTRVYQAAKAEGEQEGEQRGRQEGRQEEVGTGLLQRLSHELATVRASCSRA